MLLHTLADQAHWPLQPVVFIYLVDVGHFLLFAAFREGRWVQESSFFFVVEGVVGGLFFISARLEHGSSFFFLRGWQVFCFIYRLKKDCSFFFFFFLKLRQRKGLVLGHFGGRRNRFFFFFCKFFISSVVCQFLVKSCSVFMVRLQDWFLSGIEILSRVCLQKGRWQAFWAYFVCSLFAVCGSGCITLAAS